MMDVNKKSTQLFDGVLMAVLSVCIYSCTKTDVRKMGLAPTSFSVADAKEWWYGSFKKSAMYLSLDIKSPFAPKTVSFSTKEHSIKLPSWQNAKQYNYGKTSIVEFPLIYRAARMVFPNKDHLTTRHALFNGLNCKVLGVNLTKQLADAHEFGPNNIGLEKQMDLFNIQVGRDQYIFLKTTLGSTHFVKEFLESTLLVKIHNGELKKINPLNQENLIIPGISQLVSTN